MSKIWRALIVEDEEPARLRLRRLLERYPFIQVAGEAANGLEGLDLVRSTTPDLIFLDIEMPGLNGFELLKQLDQSPKVIFTTAYDQYAVKAFEEESVDYLLKPISEERLEKALKRLQQQDGTADALLPLERLMAQLHPKAELKTLTVKLGDRIILVKLTEILFIEAEDKYVFLQTANDKRHLTELTLAALESKLPDAFVRISRSVIVNTAHVAELRKSFNGTFSFILNDSSRSKLASGRSYGAALKERFDL